MAYYKLPYIYEIGKKEPKKERDRLDENPRNKNSSSRLNQFNEEASEWKKNCMNLLRLPRTIVSL